MSMKTPLKRVYGLGAAHGGTHHFMMQRLTGLSNLVLIIFLIAFVVCNLGVSRALLVQHVQHPVVAILLILSMLSIFWHCQLGLQVVIEDYVHGKCSKFTLLALNIFYCVALAVAAIYAILKMSFGL